MLLRKAICFGTVLIIYVWFTLYSLGKSNVLITEGCSIVSLISYLEYLCQILLENDINYNTRWTLLLTLMPITKLLVAA